MTPIRAALTALVYTDSAAANRALRSAARRVEAAGCRLEGLDETALAASFTTGRAKPGDGATRASATDRAC